MTATIDDELLAKIINQITLKTSKTLLKEFLKLEQAHQFNIVLIKSAQLLLANILCQVAMDHDELEKLANEQGTDLKDLTLNCAHTGFLNKFNLSKH